MTTPLPFYPRTHAQRLQDAKDRRKLVRDGHRAARPATQSFTAAVCQCSKVLAWDQSWVHLDTGLVEC